MTYDLVRLLHVLSIAAWLGAALWVPADVRRTLASGGDLAALRARVRPALALDLVAGLAAIVTGTALLALHGLPIRNGLQVGAGLGILLLALVGAGVRPAWLRVAARADAGDAPGARAAVGRLAALAGVGHVLWLGALSLMVLPV